MGWRDRSYNREWGNGFATENPLSSPQALFNWSLPAGTYGPVRVRMHFWLLLFLLIQFVNALHARLAPISVIFLLVATLAALLLHEIGHRVFARLAEGEHNEFLIGPFGNMLPPSHPPGPWPMFIAQTGGIFFNFSAAACCYVSMVVITHSAAIPTFINPVVALFHPVGGEAFLHNSLPMGFLYSFYMMNLVLMYINVLPFFWFDGGYILQAVLAPATGAYRAVNITCWAGMILAVVMAVMSLTGGVGGGTMLTLLVWVLLFYSSLVMLRQLRADGPELLSRLKPDIDRAREHKVKIRLRSGAWSKKVKKKAQQEQNDQAEIDRILEKVSRSGIASLSWGEKKRLKLATQRQRDRESHRPG